jgi:hypothetical protein
MLRNDKFIEYTEQDLEFFWTNFIEFAKQELEFFWMQFIE